MQMWRMASNSCTRLCRNIRYRRSYKTKPLKPGSLLLQIRMAVHHRDRILEDITTTTTMAIVVAANRARRLGESSWISLPMKDYYRLMSTWTQRPEFYYHCISLSSLLFNFNSCTSISHFGCLIFSGVFFHFIIMALTFLLFLIRYRLLSFSFCVHQP